MRLLKIPSLHNYILNRDWHWVLKCGIIADLCLKLCSSQVLWLKSGTCRIGYRNIVLFLFHYENISVGDFENINIRSLQLLPVTLQCTVTASPVLCHPSEYVARDHNKISLSKPKLFSASTVSPDPEWLYLYIRCLCNRSLISSHQRSPLPNLLLNKVWMWMFKSKFWFIFGIQIQTTYLLALGRKQRKWKNGGRRNDYFSTVLRKYRNEFLEHVK